MTTTPTIGVLALQGDVREHRAALEAAGARTIALRRESELDAVDGIVIPGGESTTMSRLLRVFDLLDPLRSRLGAGMPAYGSCAGMILLASEVLDTRPDAEHLDALDITVRRNAFGRQVDSFEDRPRRRRASRAVRSGRCSSGPRGSSDGTGRRSPRHRARRTCCGPRRGGAAGRGVGDLVPPGGGR